MALRALSIAATGGRAMMDQVDTIANNLANVNTVAYKRTRANFSDLLYQRVALAGHGEPGLNQHPTGQFFGTGVRLASTEKLFHQGALNRTERDLDLAIEGEGFLRVRLPDDHVLYTRAGNLNLDAEGHLVTSDGYPVDPPIRVPREITRIFVDQTGRVQGLDPEDPQELRELGRLELSRFVNPSGLEAAGDNLYRETPASGPRLDGEPGLDEGFGRLRQGFLEQSNVDVIKELVDLIAAQRAFEINTKSIETADQILHCVNTLRR
jgi:flagellar basal-body rod protein FlgG